MLYHLIRALSHLDFPGHNLMNYLSFRTMVASVTAILFTFIFGGKIIGRLRKKQIGETIRDLGLEGQMQKKGTPTMGGIIIILGTLIPVLLFADLTNVYIQLLILTTVWCGGIGLWDDSIKIFKKKKEGMSERTKLILQVILGLIIGLFVCYSPNIVVREKVPVNPQTIVAEGQDTNLTPNSVRQIQSGTYKEEDVVKSTKTTIPFVKNHEFDYKSLTPFKGAMGWYTKWMIYVIMIVLVITACSNGTNLTDGIDGLAAGTSAIVGIVIGILAWLSGNIVNSNYLNIMYIPGTGEIAIFMGAFVGTLIGFLWYNSYPAQVFMGDTGSLTIGGIIGVSGVLIRKELLLPLLCGIFLMESLSVLMQRVYFKATRKKYGEGRRIWSMTPLHHHFQDKVEPSGSIIFHKPVPPHHEAKITVRFWIVGIILAVSTLALLKIR